MAWLKVEVQVGSAAAAEVSERLLDLGALSASLQAHAGAASVMEPPPGALPLWESCTVTALLPVDADLADLRAALAEFPARIAGTQFLADADWQQAWRGHAVSRSFAGRLWLLPRDAPAPDAGPTLRLDPGLAFGTGAHPTTALCLEWLAREPLEQSSVLDFGCGSGVLALAARVLGATPVVAVDHDPQALAATRDNAAFNGLWDVLVGAPEASAGRTFDVVLANIVAGTLVSLAPRLTAALHDGSRLVLSGLLTDQVDWVAGAYPDLAFEAPRAHDGWVCLVGQCARAGACH